MINLTGRQIDNLDGALLHIERLAELMEQQATFLERIAVGVEKLVDNGGDTQRLDVDAIKRELRTAVTVGERGG